MDHSIWCFCYAKGRIPADFMGGCPICSNQGLVENPMLYSLILSAPAASRRRLLVVDTGFKKARSMTGASFEQVEMPDTILRKVGYRPEDVDTVILTHLHFDHAGNFDAFPNAQVYVQRVEYERWKEVIGRLPDREAGKQNWMLSSLDLEIFERFDRAVADGRVSFLEGDKELAPGITCRLAADTHTFGSQWVEVATQAGPHVIAGDCVYWYANIERMWPPGYLQGNPWNLLKTYDRLRGLVGANHLERIVPGHDMEVFRRNRSWTAGLNPVAEIHLAAGEATRIPS